MTKLDHIEFIQKCGKFHIDCSRAIFDIEKIETLEKYGHWFQALLSGDLKPISDEQKDFLDIFKNNKNPITPEQIAWFKYTGRKRLEENNPEKFELDYTSDSEDPFFNRDDWKEIRKWNIR